MEWSPSRPGGFTLGTHWISGWVGPRAGVEAVKRKIIPLPEIELQEVAIPTELCRFLEILIYFMFVPLDILINHHN
jgi:hypothetical protein